MVAVSHAINECQQIWCSCWWRNNAPGTAPGEAAAITAVYHTAACTSIFGAAVGGIANFCLLNFQADLEKFQPDLTRTITILFLKRKKNHKRKITFGKINF
jgi:hypothetical protein